jgi:hypothetical protein
METTTQRGHEMKTLLATLSIVASVAALAAQQPAAKLDHYMQIRDVFSPFTASQSVTPDNPHPPTPIGVSGADCLVLPFYGSWTQTVDTTYACQPWTTISSGPADTSYLARYNFVVNIFGPCNPQIVGEGKPDSSCTYVVTNGYTFTSYCSNSVQVTWQSFTTSARNPTSGNIEPAFVITAVAYMPLLETTTMTGTQVTFWKGSILTCNPSTCVAPCN